MEKTEQNADTGIESEGMSSRMAADLERLYQMIRQARHCVALTGAGVSTLSGIRDFRGQNGLYKEMDAQKIFDLDYFVQDPSFYYNKAGNLIYNLDEKEASIVHLTLGTLESLGFLKAVITQNIDLLHQKGGSKRVIEVHGSPLAHYCLHCSGINVSYEEVAAVIRTGKMPRCPKCGRVLKPAITFFGENLPAQALRDATEEAQAADLMLVLGSSLTVSPAASLPLYTIRRGGEVVIVNNQSTYLDDQAILHFDSLDPVFQALSALFQQA
jgi:NAD-dependent deacetylase